jgi:heme oxygenase
MTDLALKLKEGTKESHSAAENTKFVASFLRGVVDYEEYRKLLTNFYYVYDTMEQRIRETEDPMVQAIKSEDLERKEAIERDLEYYYGSDWKDKQIPSEACNTYCHRINEIAEKDPYLLIAHHYTRYIGDLSGGKILKEIAARVLKPPVGKGLDFYEFPSIPDAKAFKQNYRAVLDNLGTDSSQENALITEANYAFRLNMYMFDEIQGSASKSFLRLALSYLGSFVKEMTVSKRFR